MGSEATRSDAALRLQQSRREIIALAEELQGHDGRKMPDDFPRSWIMRTLLSSEKRTVIGAGALALGLARPRWTWALVRNIALPLARRYLLPLLFR